MQMRVAMRERERNRERERETEREREAHTHTHAHTRACAVLGRTYVVNLSLCVGLQCGGCNELGRMDRRVRLVRVAAVARIRVSVGRQLWGAGTGRG